MKKKYKRILLKLSGEAFQGKEKFGIDFINTRKIADELVQLRKDGIELGIVVGGGNIFRGRNIPKDSICPATADYMGMIGTVINSLALQAEIEKQGAECRVMTALSIKEVAEDYIRRRAVSHIQKGRIVIFAAGTGNPFFSTDTAAALRALEIDAQVIMKAMTDVDGVYTADPKDKTKNAKKLKKISFRAALVKRLNVMDSTAFSLCRDNNMPIIVFKYKPGAVNKILEGEMIGTVVS